MPCVLVYLSDKEEHEIVHLTPQGSGKSLLPYIRLFSSTLELMKKSEGQPKEELDQIFSSVGDGIYGRRIDELPVILIEIVSDFD